MVTLLEKRPGRPVGLKLTATVAVSPGAMGVFVYEGVVHPHEARAARIATSSAPSLTKRNSQFTRPSSSWNAPKS